MRTVTLQRRFVTAIADGNCSSEARELVERIESSVASISKSQVRRSKTTEQIDCKQSQCDQYCTTSFNAHHRGSRGVSAGGVFAAEDPPPRAAVTTNEDPSQDIVELSSAQQQTLLTEAGDLYVAATNISTSDSADASDLFDSAAQKYQLLVDSGIHNALLYRNLGNAYLQSNQLGRAIANYERAIHLAPADRQLAVNLEFANSLVKGDEAKSDISTGNGVSEATSLKSIGHKLRSYNGILVGITGLRLIIWTLVISSLLFWGLQIIRAAGYRFPVWRFSIVPLLLLVTSLTSAVLASTQQHSTENGIIAANDTTLYSGDGEQFDAVLSLDSAQGHRVRILTRRDGWTRIETRHGHTGWLPSSEVEQFTGPGLP